MYSVKEIFYTLQGEGVHSGRPAVFCRFTGCNLWNGKEESRGTSICQFCDTDFIGTNGQNGGKFRTAQSLVEQIITLWPKSSEPCFVVCTGGEPALQLNQELVDTLHDFGCEVAIETNGTLELPHEIDWVCVSPKKGTKIIVQSCDELKVVYPQNNVNPNDYLDIHTKNYFISPENDPSIFDVKKVSKNPNCLSAVKFCLNNPLWRISLQTHKFLDIC